MTSQDSDTCPEEILEVKRSINQELCNGCIFDNLEVGACGYCIVCSEYLCKECCRNHKKSSATRDHNIQEYSPDMDNSACKETDTETFETQLVCDPCRFDNTEVSASGFCVICVEYLCQECCRDHKKSKSTRNHNILKDKIPRNAQVFKAMKEMTSCSEHPDTPVSHKCKDHKIFVCVMCIDGSHRKCESVSELVNTEKSDLVKLDAVGMRVRNVRDKSNIVRETRKENIETLILENGQTQSKISACVDEANDLLQHLKENAIKSSNSLMNSELSRLKNDVAICNGYEKDIETFNQLLDIAKEHSSGVEMDIIAESLLRKVLGMDHALNKQQRKPDVQIKFTQNPILNEIRTLGSITMHQKSPSDLKLNKDSTVSSEWASEEDIDDDDISSASGSDADDAKDEKGKKTKKQTRKRKVNERGKCKIRSTTDHSPCSIIGGFILPGGNIVLVDDANENIKLYTRTYKIMFCKQLEARPIDICRIGPTNFALVYRDLKQIDKFLIDSKRPNAAQLERRIKTVWTIQHDRSFRTRNENYRITMFDKQIVLLCTAGGTSLGSMRLEFRQENNNQFILESMLSGSKKEEEFDFNQCGMCSTSDGVVVYTKNLGILCFVRRRNTEVLMIKWKIDLHGSIPNAERVIADVRGNLFVCSSISGSVYQIAAADHSEITTIVSRLVNPVSLIVNDKIGKLLVGCENDDNLYIFDLKKR